MPGRPDEAVTNFFGWRDGRRVYYVGPLPSLRPHLVYSIEKAGLGLAEQEKRGALNWLLAEPESLHLFLGCVGARKAESETDRRHRLARRAFNAEARAAKEVKI